jgi:signal transduction histidine kinase/CheY-like chemotaxis protein
MVGSEFYSECHRAAAEQRPIEFSTHYAPLKLWMDVHAYPSDGGLSLYFQDVTTRRGIEEQSAQSQRLEALGRLAGGVAHDFNNLLTIIGGYGQMVLDAVDARSDLGKDVQIVVDAALRASTLTRQLLAFSRRQVVQPKILDLNRLIVKMGKMLRRLIGEDIELRLELRSDLGRILADAGQIEQVIMNLAVNARDAMPTGGRLSIRTDNRAVAQRPEPTAQLAPGDYVLLAVSDTGTGIDEQTRSHIFEPFFTTKGKGKGTGLGLATVYGIAKQSGAEISVDSEPGQGACFQIHFPRASKTHKTRHGVTRALPPGGTETILLVEDDPEVRALARSMLSRLGYRVIEAGGPTEALDLFQTGRESVDLLLTDVIMPRMNGRELAEWMSAERPGLKVLYFSGYTDDVIERYGIAVDAALLRKPFSREALGSKVRAILDERQADAAAC